MVGLAETWLDEESEKGLAMAGYGVVCASRRKSGSYYVLLKVEVYLSLSTQQELTPNTKTSKTIAVAHCDDTTYGSSHDLPRLH